MDEAKALAWKRLALTWRGLALDAMQAEIAALEEAEKKSLALIALHERLARRERELGLKELTAEKPAGC